MIILERSDRFSLNLNFDEEGLIELIRKFSEISDRKEEKLNIMLDLAVFKGRKKIVNQVIRICCIDDNESKMLRDNMEVELTIERDDIEYIIERFSECLVKGYFSPAEFIRVQVENRKNPDHVFCRKFQFIANEEK